MHIRGITFLCWEHSLKSTIYYSLSPLVFAGDRWSEYSSSSVSLQNSSTLNRVVETYWWRPRLISSFSGSFSFAPLFSHTAHGTEVTASGRTGERRFWWTTKLQLRNPELHLEQNKHSALCVHLKSFFFATKKQELPGTKELLYMLELSVMNKWMKKQTCTGGWGRKCKSPNFTSCVYIIYFCFAMYSKIQFCGFLTWTLFTW